MRVPVCSLTPDKFTAGITLVGGFSVCLCGSLGEEHWFTVDWLPAPSEDCSGLDTGLELVRTSSNPLRK